MSDLIIVNGSDCLQYVNKPIGFANLRGDFSDAMIIGDVFANDGVYNLGAHGGGGTDHLYNRDTVVETFLMQVRHNINKRICGYVTDVYEDGGMRVVIMGDNETLELYDFLAIYHQIGFAGNMAYEHPDPLSITLVAKPYNGNPDIGEAVSHPSSESGCNGWIRNLLNYQYVAFDETLDYIPEFSEVDSFSNIQNQMKNFEYQETPLNTTVPTITKDKTNTLVYGTALISGLVNGANGYGAITSGNPLEVISGNIYWYLQSVGMAYKILCPKGFPSSGVLEAFNIVAGPNFDTYNGTCIPFNLLLTNNEQYAIAYVEEGTLPPDAYLYPLDFDNLPKYENPVPTGDTPEDFDDDNKPDDDSRDLDPTPTEIISFSPNQLTNYNWYWLTVPEWSDFLSWFWNDIGDFHDFDDIIAKIEGLYNDVASAVIMCRYYPVELSWISQYDESNTPQDVIKVGMIEKAGQVAVIDQTRSLQVRTIGSVHVPRKYKSFLDMTPYSQLNLYLPFHGFIDLDNDLYVGHDLTVKALYDYLSGTIQYYIFLDNTYMTNTILCKMAMDIPITLQTKNDRDSAIFNNVSSTIGGLVGAGVGIASGNPVGMALGVTQGVSAFNSANSSAPMRLLGNVGESGAYYGCQNCYITIRRPTIQPSDGNKITDIERSLKTWKHNVGMLCGFGYTLSDLANKNAGFTVCHMPRINFKSTVPMQQEIDEIYSYLESGVIL